MQPALNEAPQQATQGGHSHAEPTTRVGWILIGVAVVAILAVPILATIGATALVYGWPHWDIVLTIVSALAALGVVAWGLRVAVAWGLCVAAARCIYDDEEEPK